MLSNYTIKQALPRLVIAAIMINLSYWICAGLVDVSNLLGANIFKILKQVNDATLTPPDIGIVMNSILAGVSIAVVGTPIAAGVTALVAVSGAGGAAVGGVALMMVGLFLGLLLAVIIGVSVLAARQALVQLLIFIAPLAFAAYVLPGTKPWFDRWRKLLTTMLVFYPLFSLVWGAGLIASGTLIGLTNDESIKSNSIKAALLVMGVIAQFLPLIFTFTLIKRSSGFLGQIADRAQQRAKKLTDMPGRLGRRMASAAARQTYDDGRRRFKDYARKRHDRRKAAGKSGGAWLDNLAHSGDKFRAHQEHTKAELERQSHEFAERNDRVRDLHAATGNAKDLTAASSGRLEAHRLDSTAGRAAYSARKTAEESRERRENEAEKHRLDSAITNSKMQQHFEDLHQSKEDRAEAEAASKNRALNAIGVQDARGRRTAAEDSLKGKEATVDKYNLGKTPNKTARAERKTAEGELKKDELALDRQWTKDNAQLVSDIDTAEIELKGAETEAIGSRIAPDNRAGQARRELKTAQGQQEKNELTTEIAWSKNEGATLISEIDTEKKNLEDAKNNAIEAGLTVGSPAADAYQRAATSREAVQRAENDIEAERQKDPTNAKHFETLKESEAKRAKQENIQKRNTLKAPTVIAAVNAAANAEKQLKAQENRVETARLQSNDGQAVEAEAMESEDLRAGAEADAKALALTDSEVAEARQERTQSEDQLKEQELIVDTEGLETDAGKLARERLHSAEIAKKTKDNLLERDHINDEANKDTYLDLAASKAQLEAAQTNQQLIEDELKTEEGLKKEYGEGPDGKADIDPDHAARRLQQAVKDKTLKGQAVSGAARVLAEEIDNSIIHNTADAAVAGGLDKYGAQRAVAIAENAQEKRLIESAQVERSQLGSISDEEVKVRATTGMGWARKPDGTIDRDPATNEPKLVKISTEAQMAASSEIAHRGYAQNHIDTMIEIDKKMADLAKNKGYISAAKTQADSEIKEGDYPTKDEYDKARDNRVRSLVEESLVNSTDEEVVGLRMAQKMFISDIGNNVPFLAGDTTRGAWGRGVSYGDREEDWAKRLTQKLSAPTIQKWKNEDAKWIEGELDKAERGEESYLTDEHRQSLQDGVDTILASVDATANTKKEIKDFFDRLKAKRYIQRSFSDLAPPPTP